MEPVRILFKDEVRVVGDQLGLPHEMNYRQPFPGPGLGVRCPGAITRDRLEVVRESSPQGTITWKFMDFGTADKKCQLSSKVLFHFHELCRLRLRKTRGGDLPGLGGRRKL